MAQSPWLQVSGNQIMLGDTRFRGRGANLFDTRSCNACAYAPPNVDEAQRRADELIDVWHANFVRLDLESSGSRLDADGNARQQWLGLLDDPTYLSDVQRLVAHISSKGVYVLLSLWNEPSVDAGELPTAETQEIWRRLADVFKNEPRVLYGITNEPHESSDEAVWTAMNDAVAAIRAVETLQETPAHLIAVQGTQKFARVLDYYVSHPITAGGGVNIVYETHPYNHPAEFHALFEQPATQLPVIIGEFGPAIDPESGELTMTLEECEELMQRAEAADVPYLAWAFHMRCPPSLLEDQSSGGCGIDMPLQPTPWGQVFKNQLSMPWMSRVDPAPGGAEQPALPIGAQNVYDDDLAASFSDWSFGLVASAQQDAPALGRRAFGVTFGENSAFKLAHASAGVEAPLSAATYAFVNFYLNPGQSVDALADLRFQVENGSGSMPIAHYAALAPNTWTQVRIPLADANPSGADYSFLELSSSQGASLAIDAIWLEPAVVAPAEEPVQRSLQVGGAQRSFKLHVPKSEAAQRLPLVIAFHGDGGSAQGIRQALDMEARANGAAVFAYPDSGEQAFTYWTVAGRQAEAQFVAAIVATLDAEGLVRSDRVFLAGFSGGAVMANALACMMGSASIRGVGIDAGTLYVVDHEWAEPAAAPIGCDLPPTAIVWGEADNVMPYADGLVTRDKYRARFGCSGPSPSANVAPNPCVEYQGCSRTVRWCSIEGLKHDLWTHSGEAFWSLFETLL